MSGKNPTNGSAPGQSKAQDVQHQVDEVIGIMHNNIEKVMARGEKLESLQTKTDDLQAGALQFKRGATKIRKQMWWKDFKMKLIIVGVVAIIITVIVVSGGSIFICYSSLVVTSSKK